MDRYESLELFPSFSALTLSFSAENHKLTCIHTNQRSRIPRCRNPLGLPIRISAAELIHAIESRSGNSSNEDNAEELHELAQLAELCCCTKVHQEKARLLNTFVKLAQRWQAELRSSRTNTAEHQTQTRTPISRPARRNDESVEPPLCAGFPAQNTRSQASSAHPSSLPPANSSAPHFEPYKTLAKTTFEETVYCLLSPRRRKRGSLYGFTRSSDPDVVKCGVAREGTKKRLREWQGKCRFKPILCLHEARVPNAEQAERLVQLELQAYRKRELCCGGGGTCVVRHKEWFDRTSDLKPVMARIARWMREARPYNDRGLLKTAWYHAIGRFTATGAELNSAALVALMEEMQQKRAIRRSSRIADAAAFSAATATATATTAAAAAVEGELDGVIMTDVTQEDEYGQDEQETLRSPSPTPIRASLPPTSPLSSSLPPAPTTTPRPLLTRAASNAALDPRLLDLLSTAVTALGQLQQWAEANHVVLGGTAGGKRSPSSASLLLSKPATPLSSVLLSPSSSLPALSVAATRLIVDGAYATVHTLYRGFQRIFGS